VTHPGPLRLATAGVAVVGVCFGMARYGYGLLLPDIRRDYGLGSGTLGAIGTGSYVAYLGATALTGSFAARVGARRMAVAAALIAAAGMAVAGLSRSPAVFVAGLLVAGASAGLAFAPFADASRDLPPASRGRVLSAINCATGYGVALAAPVAILAGTAWRTAWLVFAGIAVLAALRAWRVLPPTGVDPAPTASWGGVLSRRAAPLLVSGVLIGLGSSAFWTFAVEHLQDTGALSPSTSRAFLGLVGVASVLATFSGDVVGRLGAPRAYVTVTLMEALALVLLAVAASSVVAGICSAVLFGVAYNAAVAVQALWSTHLFSDRPSLGLSAALAANGIGLMLGPLAAGLLAGPLGLDGVLLLGAVLVAAAGTLAPPR